MRRTSRPPTASSGRTGRATRRARAAASEVEVKPLSDYKYRKILEGLGVIWEKGEIASEVYIVYDIVYSLCMGTMMYGEMDRYEAMLVYK